jgi:signal transduction histidine kinase
VSHELKTPVAKQTMQLEIIKSLAAGFGESDALAKALDVMEGTLTRQRNVIRNILMVSRLEGVPESVKVESVRLDTLLESVLQEFAPVFSQFGIGCASTLAPLSVRAEKDMLWHVYSNVFGNVVKYRCREHPVVKVLLEKRGPSASVVVTDNGIGLTSEEKGKAFDRFYQASPSVEGIGLGLNIARIILERCGGSIEILSDGRGCGATVITEIPLEVS